MFVIPEKIERVNFYDNAGETIGFCELKIKRRFDYEKRHDVDYAIIEAELPKYREYTTWNDPDEAKMFFDMDIQDYREKYADM